MTKRWDRVTVVGCGLVGASFALALRRAGACTSVAGWDKDPAVLDEALRLGAIDEADESFKEGGVSQSELIYLATPVGQIVEFLRAGAPHVRPGAVVTDAGSTKVEVCRAASSQTEKHWRFVGGHPVAGSHLRGPAHARADLFEDAPYVLTPPEDGSDPSALGALAEMLNSLGARVRVMTAAEHDRALARLSHAPQLVSCALAATAMEDTGEVELEALAGPGYRDMTRLASSPWGIWQDILATNSREVADALDALILKLSAARDGLRGHSRRPFEDAEGARRPEGLAAARSLFGRVRPN
ncbi:MAG TPA: prephenate dehydrogenase/arogenate dehydrogenase family protein [Pyrinomonadaceae bacterium]|nr:prephenate dehydrogenase/arogenate dehydrogenase family protein [Pyrinomonadaceae bacterium]